MTVDNRHSDARLQPILEACYRELHEDRDPDLDRLCEAAPELRERVERMLAREGDAIDQLQGRDSDAWPEIDGFELVRPLARGGMGMVFHARQTSLRREVALKVLPETCVSDPVRRLRFRREAEITAALDHPNIVPVYETGETNGCVFLAMKLVAGDSLDRLAAPLAPRPVAEIGLQVARALQAAHDVGVVHRDMKPANVVLDGSGVANVLDFGLARTATDLTLTREGQTPGTLAYMAPEQLAGPQPELDPRLDVYGLGATLYQLLTGRPPFDEDEAQVLIRRILFYEPAPLSLPRADRDLGVIVLRALEKTPERRFQSAGDFADDLERYLGDRPIRSRAPGVLRRIGKLARRNQAAAWTLGVALVAIATLGAVLLNRVASHNADRKSRRDAVESALAEGRYVEAWRRVNEVESDATDDIELRGRVRDLLHLEALLDRLASDPLYQDVDYLTHLAEPVDRSSVRDSTRARLARLVLAVYRRDAEVIESLLENETLRREFPETVAAVRAVQGRAVAPKTTTDAPVPEETADDHVFAFVVLRIAERSPEELEDHLTAALRIDQLHGRALACQAAQEWDRGDLRLARSDLAGLWRSGGARPETHEALARLEFIDRNRERVTFHLREADRIRTAEGLPPSFQSALVAFDATFEWGSDDECRAALAALERRWSGRARWSLYRGHLAVRRGETREAVSAFADAVERATLPQVRRRARVALLRQDLKEWLPRGEAFERDGRTIDHRELLARAMSIAKEAASVGEFRVEAHALFTAHRLFAKVADRRAHEMLRRTLTAWDDHPLANHTFIHRAYVDVSEALHGDDADQQAGQIRRGLIMGERIHEARTRARRLVAKVEADPNRLPPAQLEEVLLYEAYLALIVGDRTAVVTAGRHAHRLHVARAAADDDPNVITLRSFAASLGRPDFAGE